MEHDNRAARYLPRVFAAAGYNDRVTIVQQDARKLELPCKVDVIACEMIATGLIEELQVPVMNRAHCFAKDNVRVILEQYECWADLVYNHDQRHGFSFPIVRYEYKDSSETLSIPFTQRVTYAKVDFSRPVNNTEVDSQMVLKIMQAGLINGVRIGGLTKFHGGTTLNDTFAYSYPIILPIEETRVAPDDCFELSLKYEFSKGFTALKFILKKGTSVVCEQKENKYV